MAFLNVFNKFYTGGFWNMTYSPKYPEKMSEFDRNPLFMFISYNNAQPGPGNGGGGLVSGINLHWLSVPQRAKLMDILIRKYKNNTAIEFKVDEGKPLFLSYAHIKFWMPEATIAWRRYFPNRIRNISQVAIDWNWEDLKYEVINSDTEKIVGVSPEFIQQQYIRNMQKKLWNERQRIKNKK